MPAQNDLLIALRKITRAIDLYSKRLARETGLTAPQLLVLQCLTTTGRAKPSDIARQVHLSGATITSIVDRLVRAGLVMRERSAEDRRSVEVVLTQTGKEKVDTAPDLLQVEFLSAFSALEDWEQSLLVSSVQRIASMMDAEMIDAAPILQVGEISPEAS
ncbi:MAG: MarR family transcriptional regulator [Pseudomonadota bacterium]